MRKGVALFACTLAASVVALPAVRVTVEAPVRSAAPAAVPLYHWVTNTFVESTNCTW